MVDTYPAMWLSVLALFPYNMKLIVYVNDNKASPNKRAQTGTIEACMFYTSV